MSATTSTLRLGPLPKTEVVKLTISLPVALRADLERYAVLYARTYGEEVGVPMLIPHMLQTFIERDRSFRKATAVARSAIA